MFVRGYDVFFVLFLLTFWKFESSLLRARSNKSPKILFPASIDCFGRGPAKRRWTRNRSPDLLDQKKHRRGIGIAREKGEVLVCQFSGYLMKLQDFWDFSVCDT